MEQVKVSLALLGDEENGSSLYQSVMSNLLVRGGIQLPCNDEEIVANTQLNSDLQRIANDTIRHLSVVRKWTFLMPLSRYSRLCTENFSDKDPLHRVNGLIHHLVTGPEIQYMTGYDEVISVVRKVKATGVIGPLTIAPSERYVDIKKLS